MSVAAVEVESSTTRRDKGIFVHKIHCTLLPHQVLRAACRVPMGEPCCLTGPNDFDAIPTNEASSSIPGHTLGKRELHTCLLLCAPSGKHVSTATAHELLPSTILLLSEYTSTMPLAALASFQLGGDLHPFRREKGRDGGAPGVDRVCRES